MKHTPKISSGAKLLGLDTMLPIRPSITANDANSTILHFTCTGVGKSDRRNFNNMFPTVKLNIIKKIINHTKSSKLKIGYKFGLEFLNSKNGRAFVSKLNKKIIFADLKLHDIPNTCASTVNAIKDLRINYLTIHISSGLEALKSVKKISGCPVTLKLLKPRSSLRISVMSKSYANFIIWLNIT